MSGRRKLSWLRRHRGAPELFNNAACKLATAAALACNAKLCAEIVKATATTFAGFADLIISYLAANTHVHRVLSSYNDRILDANENDCQMYLHLLL